MIIIKLNNMLYSTVYIIFVSIICQNYPDGIYYVENLSLLIFGIFMTHYYWGQKNN